MLVGDVVQAIRESITDQPQVLPAPTATFSVVSSVGSTLTTGSYFLVVTQRNNWGETLGSSESAIQIVTSGQGIQVASTLFPTATTIRAYLTLAGASAGSECQFVESSVSPFTISANPANAGAPPSRNTAYNPDVDGDSFSAATLFNWVNDCLSLASNICGGLIDYSGVQTSVGQPMYIILGKWEMIPDVWYDGYPLAPDKAGNFFRRNSITASVLSQVTTTLLTDRMMLEVWPQPARTGSSTTLSSPMTSVASSANLTNGGGFLLTNGMMQVDSEIIAYNGQSGNTFRNLIRGLGGTTPVAHNSGAPVIELNLFFHGWRSFTLNYQPGQALSTVFIPDDWSPLLPIYGLARVKLAEQDVQGYQALKKDFESSLTSWFKQNKVTTGPRQIGDVSNNLEVIPSLGGGWIVPAVLPITYILERISPCYNSDRGHAWTQFISTALLILGTIGCGMWEKLTIQRCVAKITFRNQCWSMVKQKLNGFWNCVLLDSGQSLKYWKNAQKIHGIQESVSGFHTTVESDNYSTLVLVEKLSLLELTRATKLWETSEEELHVLPNSVKKYPKLSWAMQSVKKLARRLGMQIRFSFPIQKRKNAIERLSRIGGRISLPRKEKNVLRGQLRLGLRDGG